MGWGWGWGQGGFGGFKSCNHLQTDQRGQPQPLSVGYYCPLQVFAGKTREEATVVSLPFSALMVAAPLSGLMMRLERASGDDVITNGHQSATPCRRLMTVAARQLIVSRMNPSHRQLRSPCLTAASIRRRIRVKSTDLTDEIRNTFND